MDYTVLEKSALFSGIPTKELCNDLNTVPHHIQRYDKGETIFHLMENASRIGIVLEGNVQAQKPFPNGSQINVSVRKAGELIGAAAAFSRSQKYPCDVVALESATIMFFLREDILLLLQKDLRIMKNFISELATASFMLQQRLELLSYNGIAQKAAFYLLIQARQSCKNVIKIPGSVSNWAMIMNVSRSSLHRELKKLEADKLIAYAPPVIEIHDFEALQNVLSK
jgi:CRP-like cAMP-binding protein